MGKNDLRRSDTDRMFELLYEGKTRAEIAEETGFNIKTVRWVLLDAGSPNRPRRESRFDVALAKRLHREGKFHPEIAAALGCSISTVPNLLRMPD